MKYKNLQRDNLNKSLQNRNNALNEAKTQINDVVTTRCLELKEKKNRSATSTDAMEIKKSDPTSPRAGLFEKRSALPIEQPPVAAGNIRMA